MGLEDLDPGNAFGKRAILPFAGSLTAEELADAPVRTHLAHHGIACIQEAHA